MAMTYAQVVTAAADSTWKDRVKASLLVAAIAISVDAPNTALDQRRDRLARRVVLNPAGYTDIFALPVALGFIATDNDLQAANVTDAEIDTRISSIFNDFLDT